MQLPRCQTPSPMIQKFSHHSTDEHVIQRMRTSTSNFTASSCSRSSSPATHNISKSSLHHAPTHGLPLSMPVLQISAVATQHCEASRLLRQTKSPLRKHFQDKEDPGDPSGYLAFANSRAFVPRPSKANKQALTPEAAEAASNNLFNGACSWHSWTSS